MWFVRVVFLRDGGSSGADPAACEAAADPEARTGPFLLRKQITEARTDLGVRKSRLPGGGQTIVVLKVLGRFVSVPERQGLHLADHRRNVAPKLG